MATEIPEEAAAGPYPQPLPSPLPRDRPMMESSSKAEVSADTSATVSDQAVRGKEGGGGSSPEPCSFKEGETVLAWYGERLYEAKIIELAYGLCWRAYVHYKGWKNTYNEWLLLDKLMKNTEENRKIKEEKDRKIKEEKDRELKIKTKMEKTANSGSKPKSGTGTRGRKRKAGSTQKDKPTPSGNIIPTSSPGKTIPTPSQAEIIPTPSQAEIIHTPSQAEIIPTLSQAEVIPTPSQADIIPTSSQENIIPTPLQENIITASSEMFIPSITMPPSLKKHLIDEWECITQLDKLVKLPRSPSVDNILSKYEEHRLKKEPRYAGTIGDLVSGTRDYFDKVLYSMLLYKSERRQCQEATANNVSPSSVYGAEHLLRLFVKLPEVMSKADAEEELLAEFQQNMVDLLKYLQKNQSSFFLSPHHQYSEQPATSEKQED